MSSRIMTDGEPDKNRKSCFDCYHCHGDKAPQCENQEARYYRGTSETGIQNCPFWKPALKYSELNFKQKALLSLGVYHKIKNE